MVAVALPLRVTVAPAALLAGVNVPERLKVDGFAGAAAEVVTPVLPQPVQNRTETIRHTNPVQRNRLPTAPLFLNY